MAVLFVQVAEKIMQLVFLKMIVYMPEARSFIRLVGTAAYSDFQSIASTYSFQSEKILLLQHSSYLE